jgi:putative glycosyltransferase (TIGR04372 family)
MNDLILSANCRFFLGNTSGAFVMAACQGIPIVAVNMAPMGASKAWGPNDIAVPKIYRRIITNERLAFPEIFASDLAQIRDTSSFRDHGVYLEENTNEEIFEAVREMVMCLDKKAYKTPSDGSLQKEFLRLFHIKNYTYYSQTQISAHFLRKYSELLQW